MNLFIFLLYLSLSPLSPLSLPSLSPFPLLSPLSLSFRALMVELMKYGMRSIVKDRYWGLKVHHNVITGLDFVLWLRSCGAVYSVDEAVEVYYYYFSIILVLFYYYFIIILLLFYYYYFIKFMSLSIFYLLYHNVITGLDFVLWSRSCGAVKSVDEAYSLLLFYYFIFVYYYSDIDEIRDFIFLKYAGF